ncbi:12199_t:CDS:1, partial [Gigaspora rosea]
NCGSVQIGKPCSNNDDCISLNCVGGSCGLGLPGAPCNSVDDCLNVDPEVACVGDLNGNNKTCHA